MKKDLRRHFFKCLNEIAKDKDVIFLTGDLGYSFTEDFQKNFPDQYLNCGAIEQSMIGIAAGMALVGKKPYVYSGAIFLLMRAFEQVRDDVCYNNTNVKLIGTGAAGFLGFSHNTVDGEDMSILGKFPNINKYDPQNESKLEEVLNKESQRIGPAYIRL